MLTFNYIKPKLLYSYRPPSYFGKIQILLKIKRKCSVFTSHYGYLKLKIVNKSIRSIKSLKCPVCQNFFPFFPCLRHPRIYCCHVEKRISPLKSNLKFPTIIYFFYLFFSFYKWLGVNCREQTKHFIKFCSHCSVLSFRIVKHKI